MREKYEELQAKIMAQSCNCDSINRRLNRMYPDLENEAQGVCCAKCCPCHWDRIEVCIDENLEWELI